MNYYMPPTPSALSPSVYSPTTEGVIVCGPNMNAQLPLSSSGIMLPPVNFGGMFPEASHSSPKPAPFSPAIDHSRGSILVPQPQRPANVQGFIEATRNETGDFYNGWHTSTGYRSLRDVTRTDDPGAQFGGNSNSPIITCSTSIAPQFPERSPTHPVASWNPPQTLPKSTMPIDVSHPFTPGYSPAGWATQRSGPAPNMPSAPPQQSLFDNGSHYGAMPESDGGAGFIPAGPVHMIPVALTHYELAQWCCDSDRQATFSPPPPYGSIYPSHTASVCPTTASPPLLPSPSRNTLRRPSSSAHSYTSSSCAGSDSRSRLAPSRVFSWDSNEESRFAAQSPSARETRPAVYHMYSGDDFDDVHPAASLLDRRSRSAQNEPSAWARLKTRASRASKFIFGKGPKYPWP